MNNALKIYILLGLISLIIVSTIYYLNLQNDQEIGQRNIDQITATASQTPTPQAIRSETENSLSQIMRQQLPIQNADIDIAYSPLLKLFFVRKKTDRADIVLQNFLKKNKLDSPFVQERIRYVNEPAVQVLLREEKKAFPNHPDTQEIDEAHDNPKDL